MNFRVPAPLSAALSAGVIGGGHSDTSTDQKVRCLDCERWMVHGFNVQDQVAGFTCAAEGCDWETTSEHYHYCVECAGGYCDGVDGAREQCRE